MTRKVRQGWRSKLKRWMPSVESVRRNKWVGWIGPAIYHPRLWHLNRKGVATGAAIGIFFGFLVPVLQIPVAAAVAVWLRGNIVIAISTTLITNPFTFAPIYFFANEMGAFVFSVLEPETPNVITGAAYQAGDMVVSWFDKFMSVGKNVAIGLILFAIIGAATVYTSILGIWRLVVYIEWRRRSRRKH